MASRGLAEETYCGGLGRQRIRRGTALYHNVFIDGSSVGGRVNPARPEGYGRFCELGVSLKLEVPGFVDSFSSANDNSTLHTNIEHLAMPTPSEIGPPTNGGREPGLPDDLIECFGLTGRG